MKKFLPYIACGVLTILICIFSFNIFLKTYFNQRYYSLPNLTGLTLAEVEIIEKIGNVNIVVAGNEFSKYPAGTIFLQNPSADKVVKQGRTVKVWISKGENVFYVDDFVNKNLVNVLPELQKEGVKINKTSYIETSLPYNTIIATTPAQGQFVEKDKGISFLLSKSHSQAKTVVPDIIGYTIEEAREKLTEKGLIVGEITESSFDGLDKGIVVEAASIGENVNVGTVINLVVSK